MGNSGLVSTGEVAIFDPACFIGDAEFGTSDSYCVNSNVKASPLFQWNRSIV